MPGGTEIAILNNNYLKFESVTFLYEERDICRENGAIESLTCL